MDPDWISINLHAKDSRMLEAGKSLSPPPQIDDVRFSHINLRARRAWNDKFHCFVDASMSSRRSLTSTFKTFHIDVGGIFTYFPIKSDDERGLTMKNRCLLKLFVETFSLRFLTRVKKKGQNRYFHSPRKANKFNMKSPQISCISKWIKISSGCENERHNEESLDEAIQFWVSSCDCIIVVVGRYLTVCSCYISLCFIWRVE